MKKINKRNLIIAGIVIALILFFIGIFTSTSNKAIALEEQVLSTDSDIQVEEKRRTDLIYNLADCVKHYDKHEAETLLSVVDARSTNNDMSIKKVTVQISALEEAYPELKADENYQTLMNELAITENRITEHRNTFNIQVRSYNKYVRQFPHKQILGIMGYEVIDYNYLKYDESDRKPIDNLFGD